MRSEASNCGAVQRTVPQKAGRTETSRRADGECQDSRSKRSRGTRFPLAELRGGSLLSGCRGGTSGAGRGQGPAQLSVGNRHLVLGITCRQNALFHVNQQRQLGGKDFYRHEVVEIDAISVMGMADVFR